MTSLPETKVCTKCHVEKPLTEYHKHSKTYDGLTSRCKVCRIDDTQKYNIANREKLREAGREYHAKNREQRNAERAARYRGQDTVLAKEERRNYYLETAEHQKEKAKEWRKNNPEKFRIQWRRRRALEKNTISESYTEQTILERWGTDCHICGEAVDLEAPRWNKFEGWERGLHLDHVVPISKGGPDIIENVKPAHGLCNLSKGAS